MDRWLWADLLIASYIGEIAFYGFLTHTPIVTLFIVPNIFIYNAFPSTLLLYLSFMVFLMKKGLYKEAALAPLFAAGFSDATGSFFTLHPVAIAVNYVAWAFMVAVPLLMLKPSLRCDRAKFTFIVWPLIIFANSLFGLMAKGTHEIAACGLAFYLFRLDDKSE